MYANSDLLGDTHVDTIVSMSNLAELYILQGQETAAAELQNTILELMKVDDVEAAEATDAKSDKNKNMG